MKDLRKLADATIAVGIFFIILIVLHSTMYFLNQNYVNAIDALRTKQHYDFLECQQNNDLLRNGDLIHISNLTGIRDIDKEHTVTDRQIAEAIMGKWLWPLAIIGANMPFLTIYISLIMLGIYKLFCTLEKDFSTAKPPRD